MTETGSESNSSASGGWFRGLGAAVWIAAAAKLVLHLYAGRHYGYFTDELYYLACARHLAWGYVDQPPLIALATWLERGLLGDSLSAIRLLPALSGAAKVVLTGMIARELGGKRLAQGLAALCVLLAPGMLALDHILSMNTFEPLFWMSCAYLVVRMIRTGNTRLWLWFGVLAGVGLQNKYSMAIFGFGIVAGLLLTEQRRLLWTKWLWIGGAIALLIFLPNLLWNIHYHFPFLELQRNIQRSGRNVRDAAVHVSDSGRARDAAAQRPDLAGWPLVLLLSWRRQAVPLSRLGMGGDGGGDHDARSARLLPVSRLSRAVRRRRRDVGAVAGSVRAWQWVKPVYGVLMVAMAALLAPTLIPLLPPETYIRYAAATHLQQPRIENNELGPLPQLFADQFGWQEMAATVAGVYRSLPPDVQARTAIFGQNYGQAGAIDLFGPRYGLPPAISGHQNYFLWGPRGYTGESMIVLDGRKRVLDEQFASVRLAAHVTHPYSMPYQHFDVYYCQGLKQPLAPMWPKLKNWD